MDRAKPRYSHVPWLADASDLRPKGEPETVVELPGRMALGFVIAQPFGKDTDAILTIIAEDDDLRAAVTNEMHVETPVRTLAMDMTLLSGVQRRIDNTDQEQNP